MPEGNGKSLMITITDAGKRAALDSYRLGVGISLHKIALGSGLWSRDADLATATGLLHKEQETRLDDVTAITSEQLHITGTFPSGAKSYDVTEVGIFLSNGALFGIWANGEKALLHKSRNSELLLLADLVFGTPSENLVFNIQSTPSKLSYNITTQFPSSYLTIADSYASLLSLQLRQSMQTIDLAEQEKIIA